ncbi:hypothetical protein [Nocardioides yefusunii]|uniref:DUF3558 domain-containing protein n=1 Tax=Nocardioides yefusunii TaxID=2500546 RepID=A0ABW1QYQ1_9ACTN|nr:hypothetical protein [Nocardioides yefusunii]
MTILSRRAAFAAATVSATLLLSGCTLPFGESPGATATERATTTDATDAPDSPTTGTTAGDTGTGAASEPTPVTAPSPLQYVTSDAPACTVVWSPGALLAKDYEWCRDADGAPVAGVRIGSCEVVTHLNQMYAVPGHPIMAALGDINLDTQFAQLLTSCKRHPFAR